MNYDLINEGAFLARAVTVGGAYSPLEHPNSVASPERQCLSAVASGAIVPSIIELLDQNQGSATEVELSVARAIRERCEHFDPLFRELEGISESRAAWLRESDPPTDQAIDDARALLARLQAVDFPPERVIASAEGGVGMFFRAGDRYADFECANAGSITAIVSDGCGTARAFPVDASFEGENRAIAEIRAFLER